jgi:hypothetical protein
LAAQARADIAKVGGRIDEEPLWAMGQQFIWTMRRIDEKIAAEIARQRCNPEVPRPPIKLTPHERFLLIRFERRLAP